MNKKQLKINQKIIGDKLIKASKDVSNIDELSKTSGISNTNIREFFKNHPYEQEEVKKNFLINTKKKQEEDKAQEESAEIRYVIDASISNTPDLKDRIIKICEEPNSKIILTSTTVKELVSLNRFKDEAGMDAKYILGIAAENPEKFIPVLIDENHPKPDDAIISYCTENKDKVILLSGDREMVLFARMYGVKAEYIKHMENVRNTKKCKYNGLIEDVFPSRKTDITKTYNKNEEIKTLKCVKFRNDQLFITCGFEKNRAIVVYSKDGKYTYTGVKRLEIGDEVFIAKRHDDEKYSTFSNFVITRISYPNNAILKYGSRIYSNSTIDQSLKEDKRYIKFMGKFLGVFLR